MDDVHADQPQPLFAMEGLPDLRESAEDGDPLDPEDEKSRQEFTTVYDIIDHLEELLDQAKGSLFAPSSVKVDRREFADQLTELKSMLPVQLERASSLMRESERRLENAQSQANAIISSAKSQATDTVNEAQEQAQFLVSQENVTALAQQKARSMLDQAQAKATHLTQGADRYCQKVMGELEEQLGKLSTDVKAGLKVLEERQETEAVQVPHLEASDYPEV
ncbi:ATP synthase subunit B family protein [Bifidobacterium aemilianum]|nr:cell division protein [Bifidobacterium aemilianum]